MTISNICVEAFVLCENRDILIFSNRMEYLSGLASYMILSRNQMDYNELYDNINKLIEELGDKIQKELVTRE